MALREKIKEIQQNGKTVEKEIKQRTIGYIVGGFGLVAALAWNDAIRSMIDAIFVLDKNNLLAKFIYAVVITLLVTLVTLYLMRLQQKE